MPRGRKSRLLRVAVTVATVVATTGGLVSSAHASATADSATDTIVVRWNDAVLGALADSSLGPPMIARVAAVVHTCVYDAWTAYEPIAVGTLLDRGDKRPLWEWTPENKHEAVSYAAYTAAVDLLPAAQPRFDALMADLGYPTSATTTAARTGVSACNPVLDYRHHDGSNQLGHLGGGPYGDYTGYEPANEPMVVGEPLDMSSVTDLNRWQPLIYPGRDDSKLKTQHYIAPHWGHVTPFALRSWDQFEIDPPVEYGSDEFVAQAEEIIDYAAKLTDRQKVIAEYWADGPGTSQPPGHWSQIGQFVSRRDNHTLDQDVKLFFALTNAVFDASIASWGQKRYYDYVRPITAIRYLYYDKRIPSWNRAGEGPEMIQGAEWTPYQPTWFPSPPFAEYTSGHSAFSAAGAEVLKQFTGSDHYGGSVTIPAGASDVEPGVAPRTDITLSWDTFSEASDEAGMSRRYGGIHFRAADLNGRDTGRKVGFNAWLKANRYFLGLR